MQAIESAISAIGTIILVAPKKPGLFLSFDSISLFSENCNERVSPSVYSL